MAKESGAFLSIGELAKQLNVKPHILRYWEEQFPMLEPLKRAGKRRHYRTEDVDMVRTINRLLNEEGYTVKGARKYLKAAKKAAGKSSADPSSEGMLFNNPAPAEPEAASAPHVRPIGEPNMPSSSTDDHERLFDELKNLRDHLARTLEQA